MAEAYRARVDSENTQGKPRRVADTTVNLAYDVSRRNSWRFRPPAIPGGDTDILNERQSGVELNIIKQTSFSLESITCLR